jgi:leucyl-tRNA synthetase
MSNYNHIEIETKWQKFWAENQSYKTEINHEKTKFYVLDMFPYPSGAGLHVGHPLGYIASDIISRYKRLNGFNVLHPMGFDAFGLPAEQYAIETGQHPADTTEKNIQRYKEQLNRIGFCYDWSREVRTSNPSYYKWTQWVFIQLFESWYDNKLNKARPIAELILHFEKNGNSDILHSGDEIHTFSSDEWIQKSKIEKESILQHYRLAFQKETEVNWCEALGTVLANDEVKDGLSERGGHPVTKKKMKQWFLRITAYADRLLEGLDRIDWSESIKETQRNWIGKSTGAAISFEIEGHSQYAIEVFTTRPDTLFGSTFMVLAPDHHLVSKITTATQKKTVEQYVLETQRKTERDRMMNKTVSGAFTGAYAKHPFNGNLLPIFIADYVLSSYGTGAIMAVPAHDERDHAFSKKFNLEIKQVIQGNDDNVDVQQECYSTKDGILMNSANFDRLTVQQGASAIIQLLEDREIGTRKINYKLRDAGYSRQRYWGEPFPIIYDNDGIPKIIQDLPVILPNVKSYSPSGDGRSPLANNAEWVNTPEGQRETDTMPGYAGSSWYFLRYLDPNNEMEFASADSIKYWKQVDIYVGGAEHATGHLLYARMWTKFLHDRGFIDFDEPFAKLINQGMIQGESLLLDLGNREIHIPIQFAEKNGTITIAKFHELQQNDQRFAGINAEDLVNNEGVIALNSRVEKMSKSKHNVVNPDDICNEYGADTLRLYEMFLGPLEDAKPWSINGIDGTYRFLHKLWNLMIDKDGNAKNTSESPSKDSLKTLHKTIKKITEDIENTSLNTCISQFMICVNELQQQGCTSTEIFQNLLIILSPFAPHITAELWDKIGNQQSILDADWPKFEESYLIESTKEYPISINGKMRTTLTFTLDADKSYIEQEVLKNEIVQKWLEGRSPKKIIVVPGKIVNVVM